MPLARRQRRGHHICMLFAYTSKKPNMRLITSICCLLLCQCSSNTTAPTDSTQDTIVAVSEWEETQRWRENKEAPPRSYVPPDSMEAYGLIQRPLPIAYKDAKAQIIQQREGLRLRYESGALPLDSIRWIFTRHILHTIIPYWYGTGWDFSGYTSVPKRGKIGCSYFISTTLRDAGLHIDRVKLAQQDPEDEAISLNLMKEVPAYTPSEGESFRGWEDGLYFLGLSTSHVAFLWCHKQVPFIIHSDYSGDPMVRSEFADYSLAVNAVSTFYVVPITQNDSLIKCWLYNTPIAVKVPSSW